MKFAFCLFFTISLLQLGCAHRKFPNTRNLATAKSSQSCEGVRLGKIFVTDKNTVWLAQKINHKNNTCSVNAIQAKATHFRPDIFGRFSTSEMLGFIKNRTKNFDNTSLKNVDLEIDTYAESDELTETCLKKIGEKGVYGGPKYLTLLAITKSDYVVARGSKLGHRLDSNSLERYIDIVRSNEVVRCDDTEKIKKDIMAILFSTKISVDHLGKSIKSAKKNLNKLNKSKIHTFDSSSKATTKMADELHQSLSRSLESGIIEIRKKQAELELNL